MACPDTNHPDIASEGNQTAASAAVAVSEVNPLKGSLHDLHGIAGERLRLLNRLGIHTIEDLLLLRPRSYEDRRSYRAIQDLEAGAFGIVQGRIVAAGTKTYQRGTRFTFEFIVDDGTARLHCRWWNVPYIEQRIAVGQEVVVWGKVRGVRPRLMDHPHFENTRDVEGAGDRRLNIGRMVAIYPLTEGLHQGVLRMLVVQAWERFGIHITEPFHGLIPIEGEPNRATETTDETAMDDAARQRALRKFVDKSGSLFPPDAFQEMLPTLWPTRRQAVHDLHFPSDPAKAEAARQRLALDEFVDLQWRLQLRRKNLETKAQAVACTGDNRWIKPFLERLGFALTPAQTRVLREIRQDMGGPVPMRRLLQGDVGSGKTVVAAIATLMTVESGYSVLVMAPTEILARQLYALFQRWFKPFGFPVGLRTASHREAPVTTTGLPLQFQSDAGDLQAIEPTEESPSPSHDALKSADKSALPEVWVGTHALIETGFQADNPGLVIIDEQHRFGVSQRDKLLRKGYYPHLLVMTATPIPRTLGLTLYGDLDSSVLDVLPAGRGDLKTHLRTPAALPKVWAFLRQQLEMGRQAYVVYPRVEGSTDGDVKAAMEERETVAQALHPFVVGVLHGQMPSQEKEVCLEAFRQKSIHVLVTTSIIEVGIDVPNATVMVIENADHFGLAQLHQMRGRVGRGEHASHCILVISKEGGEAAERLKVLVRTRDGFEIAEEDLKLRGPGELTGRSQSGMPEFRFGELGKDLALVERARSLVRNFFVRSKEGCP